MTSIRPEGCSNCGQFSLEPDLIGNSGTLNCTKCGYVAIENPMVSEVHYQESSNGATSVQGTMVAAGQARPNLGGRQNALDSREQTLATGRRNIRDLAAALRVPDYICEAAVGWFRLALNQNFVQGRRSQNVIATCLYVACRKEKTHHMLIDFSSKLQISVFSLGATFLKMVKALHIVKLPLADPSLFISHFAEKLHFDDNGENGKIRVIKDAIQLAKRMSEDWIHEGRRPAGIAGACVLLAARMNGFRRTNNEIVAVAHVAEDTLNKRLKEFRDTNSSELSIKQFRENQQVDSIDPPSFRKGIKTQQKLKSRLQQRTRELKLFQTEMKNHKKSTEEKVPETDKEQEPDTEKENESQSEFESESEPETVVEPQPVPEPEEPLGSSRPPRPSEMRRSFRLQSQRLSGLNENVPAQPRDIIRPAKASTVSKKKKENTPKQADGIFAKLFMDIEFSEAELNEHLIRITARDKAHIDNRVYKTPSQATDLEKRIEENAPKNLVKYLPTSKSLLDKVTSSEDLDDIDIDINDEEYFNSKEYALKKEQVWVSQNQDYLLEQERKRLKMEADELAGNTSGMKNKKRRKKNNYDVVTEAGIDMITGEELSPEETAKRLPKKSYSSKINYDNLSKIALEESLQ